MTTTSATTETTVDDVARSVIGGERPSRAVTTAEEAASAIAALEHAAWALAALARLCDGWGSGRSIDDADAAPARVLVALGLLTGGPAGLSLAPGMASLMSVVPATTRAAAITSTLRQIAAVTGILPTVAEHGWAANDDETLRAQGTASGLAGHMLAAVAVGSLQGLADRFRDGGRFLDVGTGIGALGAAFAEHIPNATVVGIDVLPRAIALARTLVRQRHLDDRFELRLQGIEDLHDTEHYDLVWIPAPFIPHGIFDRALTNIHHALRPGGWIVVGAGRLDGDDLGVAVTRWQSLLAGGTPLTTSDGHTLLAGAGFTNVATIATPPGAPVLTCAQRPQRAAAGATIRTGRAER